MRGPRLLLVETDPRFRRLLERIVEPLAVVEPASDFASARAHVLRGDVDLLIANLRLATHNGLHLVYLLSTASPIRGLLYGDQTELFLAREAQRAGAFFEVAARLPYCLSAYVQASLPALDRRDPAQYDRRTRYRGGRRGADVAVPAYS